jgi:D-alanyl-D-alanine carboxypeptidase/D-alanyl-D-alanine-endopeptidase (penicillin-binding protein 4)
VLICLTGCKSGPKENALSKELRPLLHRYDDSGAIVAARVIELPSGRELYSERASQQVLPASNNKLPVSAAGLDRFGPDATFKTYLCYDGANLWLIGEGDPGTGDPRLAKRTGEKVTTMLDRWSERLKAMGVTHVPGNLYYFDGALDDQRVLPLWSKSFLTDWYAAPVSGLNFNDNCVDITASPTTEGEPPKLEVTPPTTQAIRVENRATSAAGGTGGRKLEITREPDANVYTITGACTRPTELESKPVTDPGAFFADALATNLLQHGVMIGGRVLRSPTPLGGKLQPPPETIVDMHETPITDVLSRINKNSQNLFAEALAKIEGNAYDEAHGRDVPGSWPSGSKAVHAFLRKYKIADRDKYVMVDGSGLARENRVTAKLITEILRTMHTHPYGAWYRQSLGVAGKDGTIGKRMDDLTGHVFAKTGYIGGVRALSGYILTNDNRWLAFSIIYNQIPGEVRPFEDIQDNACRLMVAYPDVKRAELREMERPRPTTRPSTGRVEGETGPRAATTRPAPTTGSGQPTQMIGSPSTMPLQ